MTDQLTANLIVLCLILTLSMLGVALIAYVVSRAMRSAYSDAFSSFQALMVPGVDAINEAQRTLKEMGLVEEVGAQDAASTEDDGLIDSFRVFEHLSPLARPYMENYDYGLDRESDRDEVVDEMRREVERHWVEQNT